METASSFTRLECEPYLVRFCLKFFLPSEQGVPYWIFILQLSYTDKDDNGARLTALEAWLGGEGNMPSSDADPQHADQVMLITGCVCR